MDLIPTPGQVVSAASNVAHSVLYGGLADLRPMPRSLIYDGTRRELYHYREDPDVPASGDPVLLVTPLAAPALCFDLRRGCSLVEHLVQRGRPTYLVEYGEVSFADRNLGLEYWINEAIPAAIRETSLHAGGRPVHVVGWSLGGIFALLTAADRRDLPIASVTALGTPIDVTQVPLVAPLRPLLNLDGPGAITAAYRAFGGAPKPVVSWAFQLVSVQKAVTKPLAVLGNLDDRDYLAQLEAVDRFSANMMAYPGRTFGQLYHRFIKGNALQGGRLELSGRMIDVAAIEVPVLVFAGATDGIAPVRSVEGLVPLLTGSREVRFEIVPGGHLGMLTGRAARTSTWRVLDEWVDEWTGTTAPVAAPVAAPAVPPAPARKAPAKKSPARPAAPKKAASRTKATSSTTAASKKSATSKTATKKAPAKKTSTKKAPAKKAAATTDTIGTNRTRRYGSAGSRSLGAR